SRDQAERPVMCCLGSWDHLDGLRNLLIGGALCGFFFVVDVGAFQGGGCFGAGDSRWVRPSKLLKLYPEWRAGSVGWMIGYVLFGRFTGFIPSMVFIYREMLECLFEINLVG